MQVAFRFEIPIGLYGFPSVFLGHAERIVGVAPIVGNFVQAFRQPLRCGQAEGVALLAAVCGEARDGLG
jgi:hypothetical protein